MAQWQIERMFKLELRRRHRAWIELQLLLILRRQVHHMHRIDRRWLLL